MQTQGSPGSNRESDCYSMPKKYQGSPNEADHQSPSPPKMASQYCLDPKISPQNTFAVLPNIPQKNMKLLEFEQYSTLRASRRQRGAMTRSLVLDDLNSCIQRSTIASVDEHASHLIRKFQQDKATRKRNVRLAANHTDMQNRSSLRLSSVFQRNAEVKHGSISTIVGRHSSNEGVDRTACFRSFKSLTDRQQQEQMKLTLQLQRATQLNHRILTRVNALATSHNAKCIQAELATIDAFPSHVGLLDSERPPSQALQAAVDLSPTAFRRSLRQNGNMRVGRFNAPYVVPGGVAVQQRVSKINITLDGGAVNQEDKDSERADEVADLTKTAELVAKPRLKVTAGGSPKQSLLKNESLKHLQIEPPSPAALKVGKMQQTQSEDIVSDVLVARPNDQPLITSKLMTSNNSNNRLLNMDLKGTLNASSHGLVKAPGPTAKTSFVRKSDMNAGASYRTLTNDEVVGSQLLGEGAALKHVELMASPSVEQKSGTGEEAPSNGRPTYVLAMAGNLHRASEKAMKSNWGELSQRQKVVINKHLIMKKNEISMMVQTDLDSREDPAAVTRIANSQSVSPPLIIDSGAPVQAPSLPPADEVVVEDRDFSSNGDVSEMRNIPYQHLLQLQKGELEVLKTIDFGSGSAEFVPMAPRPKAVSPKSPALFRRSKAFPSKQQIRQKRVDSMQGRHKAGTRYQNIIKNQYYLSPTTGGAGFRVDVPQSSHGVPEPTPTLDRDLLRATQYSLQAGKDSLCLTSEEVKKVESSLLPEHPSSLAGDHPGKKVFAVNTQQRLSQRGQIQVKETVGQVQMTMNIVNVGAGRVDEHHSQLSQGAPSQSYGEATPIKRVEEVPNLSIVETKRNLYSQIFDATSVLVPKPNATIVELTQPAQVDIPTGLLAPTQTSEHGVNVAATGVSQIDSTRVASMQVFPIPDSAGSKELLLTGGATTFGCVKSGRISPLVNREELVEQIPLFEALNSGHFIKQSNLDFQLRAEPKAKRSPVRKLQSYNFRNIVRDRSITKFGQQPTSSPSANNLKKVNAAVKRNMMKRKRKQDFSAPPTKLAYYQPLPMTWQTEHSQDYFGGGLETTEERQSPSPRALELNKVATVPHVNYQDFPTPAQHQEPQTTTSVDTLPMRTQQPSRLNKKVVMIPYITPSLMQSHYQFQMPSNPATKEKEKIVRRQVLTNEDLGDYYSIIEAEGHEQQDDPSNTNRANPQRGISNKDLLCSFSNDLVHKSAPPKSEDQLAIVGAYNATMGVPERERMRIIGVNNKRPPAEVIEEMQAHRSSIISSIEHCKSMIGDAKGDLARPAEKIEKAMRRTTQEGQTGSGWIKSVAGVARSTAADDHRMHPAGRAGERLSVFSRNKDTTVSAAAFGREGIRRTLGDSVTHEALNEADASPVVPIVEQESCRKPGQLGDTEAAEQDNEGTKEYNNASNGNRGGEDYDTPALQLRLPGFEQSYLTPIEPPSALASTEVRVGMNAEAVMVKAKAPVHASHLMSSDMRAPLSPAANIIVPRVELHQPEKINKIQLDIVVIDQDQRRMANAATSTGMSQVSVPAASRLPPAAPPTEQQTDRCPSDLKLLQIVAPGVALSGALPAGRDSPPKPFVPATVAKSRPHGVGSSSPPAREDPFLLPAIPQTTTNADKGKQMARYWNTRLSQFQERFITPKDQKHGSMQLRLSQKLAKSSIGKVESYSPRGIKQLSLRNQQKYMTTDQFRFVFK